MWKEWEIQMNLCKRHRKQMLEHGEIIRLKNNRDRNEITINGDIIEISLYSKGIEIGKALVSSRHYDKVKDHKWHVRDLRGYVSAIINDKNTRIHRFITDCPDNMVVDHIDHNPLNNTDSNLRICTTQENQRNQKHIRSNKTGHVGVQKANKNSWRACVRVNGKNIYSKCFNSIQETIDARKEMEEKYFGSFAYQVSNHGN